ncbi:MAG: TonB-dependent receptor [Acidobacteria bacterium]|nr:TonB-dependent receptor [Acidobacteriota bacterium]
MSKTRSILLFFVVLFACTLALAQSQLGTGAISGTVTDPSGQIVPDASVTVTSVDAGFVRTVNTTGAGVFTVPVLPPGTYTVKVEKSGFSTLEQKGVVVSVGGTATLQLAMKVGAVASVVEVTAEAAAIDTARTDQSSLVTREQINELPLNGRRYDQFALLTPGVARDGSYGNITYHGISGAFNNFTVEGNDDNSLYWATTRGYTRLTQTTSANAIQEFQVGQTNFLPEFGRAVGGSVNAVMRSGGNKFHLDAFEYLKNSALSARDTFASFKPDESRHQFGGSISGPIRQNKLFYFLNYDQQLRDFPLLIQDTNNSLTANKPVLPNNPTAAQQAQYNADLNAWQTGIAYIKSKFPGGAPGNILPRNFNEWLGTAKVDWILNQKNTASFTYNHLRHDALNGIQTAQVLSNMGGNGSDLVITHQVNARLVSTISPALVNEFRFQWAKDFDTQMPDARVPYVSANGFNWGTPSYLPRWAYPDERKLQFVNNFSVIKGAHAFKFGLEVVKSHELLNGASSVTGGFYGSYSYSTATQLGYDLLNNGRGCGTTTAPVPCYTTFAQAFGVSAFSFSARDYAAFAQDSWKLRRNVTLNYGLRWDYQKWPDPQFPNPAIPQSLKINADNKNVGPRAGIAWDLFGNGKTVVRGGYGMMFARSGNSMIENVIRFTGLTDPSKNLASLSFTPTTLGAPAFPNTFTSMPTSGTGGSATAYRLASEFRRPRIQEWNIGIERQLPLGMIASVSYIYTYGDRMQMMYDTNMIPPNFTLTWQLPNGNTFQTPYSAGMTRTAAGATLPNTNGSRPNPAYGAISEISALGKNWYNGMLVELKRRFQKGLALNVAYTLAKAENLSGTGSGYGGGSESGYGSGSVLDQFHLNANRAAAGTDQRNRLVANGVWEPAWKSGNPAVNKLIHGYRFSSIVAIESGRPYSPNISLGTTRFQTPDGAQWQGMGGGLYGQGGLSVAPGNKRNSFYATWRYTIDLRALRQFRVTERLSFELMGEVFNLINHPNYYGVNTSLFTAPSPAATTPVGTPIALTQRTDFGTPYTTSIFPDGTSARRFQLAARLRF